MSALPYDPARLHELARLLIGNIRELAEAGWTPATSSNVSHRHDDHHDVDADQGPGAADNRADDGG